MVDTVIFTRTQINRRFCEIQTSAAVLFDVGGGGAWQVYSHWRWVTASCFMARCSTSGRAAIGHDEPRRWDLSVLLGITNKTDSPMFYGHRCYDSDTEKKISTWAWTHKCKYNVSICGCVSFQNIPRDSSLSKIPEKSPDGWFFISGETALNFWLRWTEFWLVSKNERNLWLIWVMKDKKQT